VGPRGRFSRTTPAGGHHLTIAGTGIRQDDAGRYCLKDLRRAAGGEKVHQPANWLRLQQTQDLVATMSSCEIAELTGKEHRNVMRDIRTMLAELHGEDRVLSFERTVQRPNPSGGAPIASIVYALLKREMLILVSGCSTQMRARTIDRRQVLPERPPPRRGR
jgi:hypothetical protein